MCVVNYPPIAPSRPVPVATLKTWTPWPFPGTSLLGRAAVTFSGGRTVREVPVFRRDDGSMSVGVPNAAQIDRDGRQRTDAAGKRQYSAVVLFETTVARERWQQAIIRALVDAGIAPSAGDDAP